MTTKLSRMVRSVLPPAPNSVLGRLNIGEWWRTFIVSGFTYFGSWTLYFVAVRLLLIAHPSGSWIAPTVALFLAILTASLSAYIMSRAQRNQGVAPVEAGPPIPRTLLIVEDEDSIARGMQRLFELKGWKADVVGTATDAMLRVRERYAWMILDMRLPDGEAGGAGGEAVLAKVRAEGIPVFVAIVSGNTERDVRRILDSVGAEPDLVFTKGSVTVSTLVAAMVDYEAKVAAGAGVKL